MHLLSIHTAQKPKALKIWAQNESTVIRSIAPIHIQLHVLTLSAYWHIAALTDTMSHYRGPERPYNSIHRTGEKLRWLASLGSAYWRQPVMLTFDIKKCGSRSQTASFWLFPFRATQALNLTDSLSTARCAKSSSHPLNSEKPEKQLLQKRFDSLPKDQRPLNIERHFEIENRTLRESKGSI